MVHISPSVSHTTEFRHRYLTRQDCSFLQSMCAAPSAPSTAGACSKRYPLICSSVWNRQLVRCCSCVRAETGPSSIRTGRTSARRTLRRMPLLRHCLARPMMCRPRRSKLCCVSTLLQRAQRSKQAVCRSWSGWRAGARCRCRTRCTRAGVCCVGRVGSCCVVPGC